jgi:hypothetical protein
MRPASTKEAADNLVDGSKNPELLLPWELYEFLVSTAFHKDTRVASAWRAKFASAVPRMAITPDFWSRLEAASRPYLDLQHRLISLSDRMAASSRLEREPLFRQTAEIERAQCSTRMIALEQSNATLGSDRFGEFLYSAVAPNLKVSSATPISAEQHRRISRGCR